MSTDTARAAAARSKTGVQSKPMVDPGGGVVDGVPIDDGQHGGIRGDDSAQPEPGTETQAPAANVIEAIRRVMADMPGIGKDGRADPKQGGYAYRGIDQITTAIQGLCAKHGVVPIPKVLNFETRDIVVNAKPWTDTILTVRYTVRGPGGKKDRIKVGPFIAIGRDNTDKGPNKCMTQAFKQMLLQLLVIADSKDDTDGQTHEADERTASAPRPRADQPLPDPALADEVWDLQFRARSLDTEGKAELAQRLKGAQVNGEPLPFPMSTLNSGPQVRLVNAYLAGVEAMRRDAGWKQAHARAELAQQVGDIVGPLVAVSLGASSSPQPRNGPQSARKGRTDPYPPPAVGGAEEPTEPVTFADVADAAMLIGAEVEQMVEGEVVDALCELDVTLPDDVNQLKPLLVSTLLARVAAGDRTADLVAALKAPA